VRDLDTMLQILNGLGVRGGWESADSLRIEGGEPTQIEAPYDLVRTMRASFMVLGPLIARCGHASVSIPGSCAIGCRPVDQHLKGSGAGRGISSRRLRGGARGPAARRAGFDVRTVNGTQNVLMAACLADGVSEIENAACEPEVLELIAVLRAMGARIDQASSEHLIVQGVSSLSGVRHRVAGDRIEAATLLVCGGILPGGDVKVTGIVPEHNGVVLDKLREAGLGGGRK
jgi:UDP-N-acetylglucosamine 1-carboxyvinyltransferase